jgi:Na+/H+-dicarboxylate symporter
MTESESITAVTKDDVHPESTRRRIWWSLCSVPAILFSMPIAALGVLLLTFLSWYSSTWQYRHPWGESFLNFSPLVIIPIAFSCLVLIVLGAVKGLKEESMLGCLLLATGFLLIAAASLLYILGWLWFELNLHWTYSDWD